MASTLKYVRVPPNSASLAEARQRVFEFFKTACRSIPTIMDIYTLDDVTTPSQLRSVISSEIRKNADVTNTKVIDMLLFKGTEELSNIVEHAKQRHHILGQYVLGRDGITQDLGTKDQGASDFLKNFYKSNYF
ncbi:NADH dehydrogenase [ubiquinone] 1 alpha subcomplex subunit 6 [Phtheirospermum japonicum]|uniref:NADH dehydrogenase [ubiquinone] 1 alpha subcomplex subunit 6 n=1 Tax=Phtheirospermum japonicum TaxID=374723 RepID=A0A830CG09_9LAMI|nr:NADH dehydrogenase [ubiquinone] 1 alpha subcomplex subunit 6 [Phtheirospermum japonicum]